MSGRIDQFSPKNLDPTRWQVICPIARDWVMQAEPSKESSATAWMNVVTQILVFCDTNGLALNPSVVFSPQVVEHFIAEGCARLSSGTRANYRSHLRSVGERVLGPEASPQRTVAIRASDPAAPYSEAEIAALLGWANGQTTGHRRYNTRILIGLGLGAGLSTTDIATLVGTDVTVDDLGVLVNVSGPDARTVPVLRRWEDHVLEAAELCGDRPMFRPRREGINRHDIHRLVETCRPADAPPLSVRRLRVTWLVHHLRSGTPITALLPAAGVRAKQLAQYYRFVPPLAAGEARRRLREAGSQ